jgi:hypothetical protein
MKLKNFRVINSELFEADSSDDGDIYIYQDINEATDRSNEYRRQGYKCRALKLASGQYVVYFRLSKPKPPKISLSRRFNGKDYYPERSRYDDIVIRSRDSALDKANEYKNLGYSCKIVDYLIPEDLVIIYMRHIDMDIDDIFSVVLCED